MMILLSQQQEMLLGWEYNCTDIYTKTIIQTRGRVLVQAATFGSRRSAVTLK